MTTAIDPDILRILERSRLLPDEFTDAYITIADNMLARANGDINLAVHYFNVYVFPEKPK